MFQRPLIHTISRQQTSRRFQFAPSTQSQSIAPTTNRPIQPEPIASPISIPSINNLHSFTTIAARLQRLRLSHSAPELYNGRARPQLGPMATRDPNLGQNSSHLTQNGPLSTSRRYRSDRWNNENDGIPDAPDSRQFGGFDQKNFVPGLEGKSKGGGQARVKPKEVYEKNVEKPDPKLEDSRFMKFYGMQRNEFGHEAGVNDEARRKADRWMWSEMVKKFPKLDGPARFGSHYHKMLTRKFANQKRDKKLSNNRFKRQMDAILHGALSIGTFITIMYDSDAGWRGLLLLATAAVVIGIVFPLFMVLVMFTWLGAKWRNRNRDAERLALLAKYGEDENEEEHEKNGNSARERLARLEARSADEPSLWDQVLITLGLKKEKKNDADTIVGGIMKVIDIDPDNFDPKQFWVQKFPHFDWTYTGTGSGENGQGGAADKASLSAERAIKLGRSLEGYPMFNAAELKQQLLDAQTAQVKEIREQGPKGMLDFMVSRLQAEQDELRLDRDVLLMNIDRVADLLKKNLQRYKSAVRLHRPGHVLELYEQTIDGQRMDLDALRDDLGVVDQRGWELKRRLEIIQQSLHNAIYSNLNGIEHPVVNELIKSDLQQVLFGHMPSDLLDQPKLFELASLLAPLQHKLIKGKLSLDQVGDTLYTDFGYFFPDSYNFNEDLPHISGITQANTNRTSSYRIQHVLEPLIESGPATQQLIQIAVTDFDEEFRNKFAAFDLNSDGRRVQYIKEQRAKVAQEAWDRATYFERATIGLNNIRLAIRKSTGIQVPDEDDGSDEPTQEEIDAQRRADREKYELQMLKFQHLRDQSLKEREERQFRYETNTKQFDSATRRQLGAFGKDLVGKAANVQKQFDVPKPPGYEKDQALLFLKDGSFVGGYDQELQQKRDQYNMEWLMEREREDAIAQAKEQQEEIIQGVSRDPRLLHQLETDRIAFGTPIITNREYNLHEYNKFTKFISKIPFMNLDDYGTKEYQEQMTSLSNASPEFWSGSIFQDQGTQVQPIASLYDTLPRTIANAMGFKRKDSDFEVMQDGFDDEGNPISWTQAAGNRIHKGNYLAGPNVSLYSPTVFTKEDIEQASDVALRSAVGKQQSMYQKWQGTVAASRSSRDQNQLDIADEPSFVDIRRDDASPNGSVSHWRHRERSREGIDNSHLQIDTTHARPVSAIGPLSERLRSETTSRIESLQDRLFSDPKGPEASPISPTSSQQQTFARNLVRDTQEKKYTINIGNSSSNPTKAPGFSSTQSPNPSYRQSTGTGAKMDPRGRQLDDIEKKWVETFPALHETSIAQSFDPAKASQASDSSPLMVSQLPTGVPSSTQETDFLSSLNLVDEDRQWDLGFDEFTRIDQRSQIDVIKELVRKEEDDKLSRWLSGRDDSQPSTPPEIKNASSNINTFPDLNQSKILDDSRQKNIPQDKRGPASDIFMEELKKNRVSKNW